MYTGKSELKLKASTIGSSRSGGRSGFARSTLSFTRWRACSMSSPAMNSTSIVATFSAEVDRISLIPSTSLSCFSIGIVMSFSISTGAVPS